LCYLVIDAFAELVNVGIFCEAFGRRQVRQHLPISALVKAWNFIHLTASSSGSIFPYSFHEDESILMLGGVNRLGR
jgi:hypothetical protein